MDFSRIERIYRKTDGNCHICYKKLSLSNYGKLGNKGAWEIEHSVPRVKGGTDHSNNLFAACISCNRDKGTHTSRTARAWHGRTKAPLSREKKEEEAFGMAVGAFSLVFIVVLVVKFFLDKNPFPPSHPQIRTL